MSNEKLSDRDLTYLRDLDRRANDCECDTDDLLNALPEVVQLVDELRAHRSRELSETDRLALSYALDLVRDHGCKCGACRATTAERVLTRLVEQKP